MGINRKVVEVYCDVCKLTFLSQAVLDTHLTGYKHQRKLKSIELLETLRKTEQCFELDSVSGEIRCLFCDITLNSPQHLSTHVKGDKHIMEKGKRENGDQGGTPAKKLRPGAPEQRNGGAPKPTTKKTTTPPQPTKVKIPPPAKKERPPLNITIPAYVTKVEDNKAGGKFLCNPCQAHCNSDIQLSQHLKSKKHLDKFQSKELLKSLDETESTLNFDHVSGEVKCTICDVALSSPQMLSTHVAGNKHQSRKCRLENGEDFSMVSKMYSDHCNNGDQTNGNHSTSNSYSKKDRPLISLPSYVTKIEDNKGGGKYLCAPCQSQCNSDTQLSQHLSSKKHLNKLSGKKKSPSYGRGGARGWRNSSYNRGRGGSSTRGGSGTQRWDPVSPNSVLNNASSNTYQNASSFQESTFSSNYSDSYGLSSLGRGSASEVDVRFGRSGGSSSRGGGGRGYRALGRSGEVSRSDGGDYGRGNNVYARAESYSRSEYGNDYSSSRTDNLNSYNRAATVNSAHGYGAGQNMGHSPGRGMPISYTHPLSHNFVSGGTIL